MALTLAVALAAVFVGTPKMEERAALWWLRYHAHHSGLKVRVGEFRTGWGRPLEIKNLQLASSERTHLELFAPRVEVTFDFAHMLRRGEDRHGIRFLRVEHAQLVLRGRAGSGAAPLDWSAINSLLPDGFDLSFDKIVIDQSVTHFAMNDVRLAASEGNGGVISMATASIASPRLQQTFSNLHGVTRWQDDHLTLAGLTLRRDFSLDSLALDFSQMLQQRLAAELAMTLFGGTLRANLATAPTAKTRIWEGAASALEISLSEVTSALGFIEPITGTLHASKFTFRGDPRDFVHATGSVWVELTGFSWRKRQAENIMLGASMYDRTVQLQELYLKQRHNQFTLSGETTLGPDWLNPDFRGDISAAIDDLGELAELFGGSRRAFAGKLAARGRVHTHERKVDGELALTGDGLALLGVQIDSLTGRVTLDSARVRIEQLELKHDGDVLRATGDVDFARNLRLDCSVIIQCRELAEYRIDLPLAGKFSGPFFGTVIAEGDRSRLSGTLSAAGDHFNIFSNAQWRPDLITFQRLDLSSRGTGASFTAKIDYSDRHRVRAEFNSAQELRAQLASEGADCVRGLTVSPGLAGEPFHRIECDGRNLLLDGASRSQLCRQSDKAAELRINIPPP